MLSWGDGAYENTAATLVGAAEAGVAALELRPGAHVLDLGCGTGNAALAAARRGARVTAVDPAPRLVEVARQRAAAEGRTIDLHVGEAGAIPAPDAAFDAIVSIFAVIFAPDAERAADEMWRVLRPGGRLVVTTWTPHGPIAEAGALLRAAMASLAPSPGGGASSSTPGAGAGAAKPPPWGDEAAVRALFAARGAEVRVTRAKLPFEAASPEAWFAEQQANHPVWRFVHRALAEQPERWASIREASIARLAAGNEAEGGFRVTSDYLVVVADRPG